MSTQTLATTSTGQYHPGSIGYASEGGATAIMGNTLYYLVSSANENLKMVTANLSGLVESGNLSGITSDSNWDHYSISEKMDHSNNAHFQTEFVPAMVTLNNTLYMFWADEHDSGKVYLATMDSFGTWCDEPWKVEVNGDDLVLESDFTAHAFGDQIVLYYFDTDSEKLVCVSFDMSSLSSNDDHFNAAGSSTLNPSNFGYNLSSSYYRISSDWFTQGDLGNYMLVSFYSSSANVCQFIAFPINDDGTPNITSNTDQIRINHFSAKRGVDIKRDPAGRIVATYCTNDSDENLRYRFFNTGQDLQSGDILNWGSAIQVNDQNKDSEKKPTSAFVYGNTMEGTVNLAAPDGETKDFDATLMNIFSFVFYADGDSSNDGYHIQVQTANYGQSKVVPNYSAMVPDEGNQDKYTLSLLMDSFPFPNENIGSSSPGESVVNYTYGTSSSTNTNVEFNWGVQFGIKTELSTSKGVGPAAEGEFRTGPEGSLGSSSQSKIGTGWSMNTSIVNSNGQNVISPKSRMDGHTLLNLSQTAALFYDANNEIANGVTAPLFNILSPVPGHESYPTSATYNTFSSTPGNIESYQEDTINNTMSQLYANAVASGKENYFTPGYGSNYITDVIEPNAYAMPGGLNYLEFTVNPTGGSINSFQQINSALVTAGLTIDSSLYGGIGFGAEISLFGFGEEMSGSAMAGFSYQLEILGGLESTTTWGVDAIYRYQNNVPGSKRYSVRMYICKPNNMWAREVQFMSSNVEDRDEIVWDDSIPMKIMFVVYGINTNS